MQPYFLLSPSVMVPGAQPREIGPKAIFVPLLPLGQSRDFATALTRLGHPPTFAEFSIFEHGEARAGRGLGLLLTDVARLFGVLVTLLRSNSEGSEGTAGGGATGNTRHPARAR